MIQVFLIRFVFLPSLAATEPRALVVEKNLHQEFNQALGGLAPMISIIR
jgi:hypothetical protein